MKQADETPTAYLRRYRLMETQRFLSTTNYNLQDIASYVGYRDGKALYRAWVRAHDIPPMQWRRQFQNQ